MLLSHRAMWAPARGRKTKETTVKRNVNDMIVKGETEGEPGKRKRGD
jgi:hypothetical protein